MDFVHVEIHKIGEHRGILARADGPPLVVAEAQVRGQAALANHGSDRAIKDVHKAFGIFLIGVATHGRLVHGDLGAARFDQRFQFGAHDGHQRFGDSVAVRVALVGDQPSAERVRTGNAGFQSGATRRQTFQALVFFHHTQPARRGNFVHDGVLATLVVCRRAKDAQGSLVRFDTL